MDGYSECAGRCLGATELLNDNANCGSCGMSAQAVTPARTPPAPTWTNAQRHHRIYAARTVAARTRPAATSASAKTVTCCLNGACSDANECSIDVHERLATRILLPASTRRARTTAHARPATPATASGARAASTRTNASSRRTTATTTPRRAATWPAAFRCVHQTVSIGIGNYTSCASSRAAS